MLISFFPAPIQFWWYFTISTITFPITLEWDTPFTVQWILCTFLVSVCNFLKKKNSIKTQEIFLFHQAPHYLRIDVWFALGAFIRGLGIFYSCSFFFFINWVLWFFTCIQQQQQWEQLLNIICVYSIFVLRCSSLNCFSSTDIRFDIIFDIIFGFDFHNIEVLDNDTMMRCFVWWKTKQSHALRNEHENMPLDARN